MKVGRSIEELAREIQRQQNSKADYIARTDSLLPELDDEKRVVIKMQQEPAADSTRPMLARHYGLNDLAHQQVGSYTGIPKTYYDKMLAEEPELLATNIGVWFRKHAEQRLVRTLDGRVRAFLSDGYRPLENYDLAEAVLPTLLDNGLIIMSSEITEKRLYIKAVDPRIERDVPTGRRLGDGSHVGFDTLAPAIIISNSEVGCGRLSVETGTYTRACTNLCMWAEGGMKRRHVGARHEMVDSIENIDNLLSSETRKATDKAIFLQVRDVVKGAFDETVFAARCRKIAATANDRIEGDPIKAIELSAKKFGLSEIIAKSVQRHLIESADLTRYGLFNAVTRAGQDVESYDEATSLERLGGKIVELPRHEWEEIALAA